MWSALSESGSVPLEEHLGTIMQLFHETLLDILQFTARASDRAHENETLQRTST